MENVKFIEGEKLTICVSGRIDTSNAQAVQKCIEEKLSGISVTGVIIDADELEYISSAGLRILMILKKKISDIAMVNASREVYEILEMTGFVDLLNVKKALRKISVDNLETIGQGTCGKVYRIDDETIVKVFNEGFDIKNIEAEKANAQKSFINGIETAISFDMVRVGNQIGLVYEMLDADTFRGCMKKTPEKIEEYISIYADFLKSIHNIHFESGALPEEKLSWVGAVDYIKLFNDEEKAAVKAMLEAVPERDTFIHGDYNVGNVMFQDGRAILIDMATTGVGHPVFDLAGVFLGLQMFPNLIPEEYCMQMTGFNKADNVIMWNKFCEVYFGATTEESRKDIEGQLAPFAAYRVIQASMTVTAFPEQMINYCKKILMDALASGNQILKF